MSKFDPPSDPFGDEKRCSLCDGELEYNEWTKEYYCPSSHEPMAYCDECGELVEEEKLKPDPFPVAHWRVCPSCFAHSVSIMGGGDE